jgi:type IV pilus assembly protein PilQ
VALALTHAVAAGSERAPDEGARVVVDQELSGSLAQNQAVATAPARPAPATQTPRTYTGAPVSLDFNGADLRAVLRTFAEISGLNVVIDPAVRGTVDVTMRDVPWDQALDVILRANKLGYVLDGTVVRIAPLGVLAEEEKQRRKLLEEQALSGDLRIATRTLNYAKADDVARVVTKSALTPRGTVQVDPRTNTLVISDLQRAIDAALSVIAALDGAQPQVEIEARIVQTSRDFARTIGVQWGLGARVAPELGNTTALAFPNSGSLSGRTGAGQGPSATPTAVDLGIATASSAIGLALGAVNGAFSLDVALTALERAGHGRLLSTPRVATQNNVEAEITQGVQIPIQTVANNTVAVTFKDAALTLKVTPQITAAGTVIMKIVVENAAPDFSRAVGTSQIPPIDTQRAMTQVLVNDGQTTVIGGIYVSRAQSVSDRTPALHRLPLLGWLFRRQALQDESRELLIFITPRIIRT